MSKIPPLHIPSIPVGVINTLVTCVATVSKDNRRCLRPRVQGSDYCCIHIDTISPTTKTQKNVQCHISLKRKDRDNSNDDIKRHCKKKKESFASIANLKDDVSNFFRRMSPCVKNILNWDIQCVEDAFCSERNMPFALGLQVRRYFPGYGR